MISGLCAMLYRLLGDLWDKFTASLLPDPLLKCLLSSQTHLHGDSGKKLLVWKSKFLHKWLPMETGFVPKPDNREEDQALITQLDLGLQRQQPHSVQSCTGWGTIAKEVFTSVYISSLVMFSSCYSNLQVHDFPWGCWYRHNEYFLLLLHT